MVEAGGLMCQLLCIRCVLPPERGGTGACSIRQE